MRTQLAFGGIVLAAALGLACKEDVGDPDILPWKASPVWRVGGEGNQGLSLAALYPFQVDADPDRVFLLDQSTQRVFLLDPEGHVTDTLGRAGSGPGEFTDPWAIASDRRGGFAVVDLGARQLVSWSRDLALGSPVPIGDLLDSPQLRFRESEPTFLIAGTDAAGTRQFQLTQVGAKSRSVLAAVDRPPRRVVDLPSCEARQIAVTPLFAPTIHWDTRGSLLVVAAGSEYAIDVYDGPQKIASLTLPIPAARATEADALRAAENWMFNDCLVPPAEVVRTLTYLETMPVIENVALAPDSLVWVQRGTASRGNQPIDLFNLSGQFLGTLDNAIPFPAAFLDANRFVAIERDSLDLPSVVAYRIDRLP